MRVSLLHDYVATCDLLADDVSKTIYDAKVRYWITRKPLSFYEVLAGADIVIPHANTDLDHYDYFKTHSKNVVLLGAGFDCPFVFHQLRLFGYVIDAIYDSAAEKIGTTVCGLVVKNARELFSITDKDAMFVVISSTKYKSQLAGALQESGFLPQNFLIPLGPGNEGLLRLFKHDYVMYFNNELVRPNGTEILATAGVCDLRTCLQFIEWCKGDYEHIYGFEPSSDNYALCERILARTPMKSLTLSDKALWSKPASLTFYDDPRSSHGSRLSAQGGRMVETIDLDSYLSGRPITILTLDVEGAELEVLKGASDTIKTHNPRLAISIYHKPEDLLEIPNYIKSLNPDYNLYIRHCGPWTFETILYAL